MSSENVKMQGEEDHTGGKVRDLSDGNASSDGTSIYKWFLRNNRWIVDYTKYVTIAQIVIMVGLFIAYKDPPNKNQWTVLLIIWGGGMFPIALLDFLVALPLFLKKLEGLPDDYPQANSAFPASLVVQKVAKLALKINLVHMVPFVLIAFLFTAVLFSEDEGIYRFGTKLYWPATLCVTLIWLLVIGSGFSAASLPKFPVPSIILTIFWIVPILLAVFWRGSIYSESKILFDFNQTHLNVPLHFLEPKPWIYVWTFVKLLIAPVLITLVFAFILMKRRVKRMLEASGTEDRLQDAVDTK